MLLLPLGARGMAKESAAGLISRRDDQRNVPGTIEERQVCIGLGARQRRVHGRVTVVPPDEVAPCGSQLLISLGPALRDQVLCVVADARPGQPDRRIDEHVRLPRLGAMQQAPGEKAAPTRSVRGGQMAVHRYERWLRDEYAEGRLPLTHARTWRPANGRAKGHRLLDVPRATSGALVNAYENARRIALASDPAADVVHQGAATQVPRRSHSI